MFSYFYGYRFSAYTSNVPTSENCQLNLSETKSCVSRETSTPQT